VTAVLPSGPRRTRSSFHFGGCHPASRCGKGALLGLTVVEDKEAEKLRRRRRYAHLVLQDIEADRLERDR